MKIQFVVLQKIIAKFYVKQLLINKSHFFSNVQIAFLHCKVFKIFHIFR